MQVDSLISKSGSGLMPTNCNLGKSAAQAAVFLLSDSASYINGVLLPGDGGAVAGVYSEFMESGDTGKRV